MITNREEVLENALRIFAKMNYEKASQSEIAKACGLSKAGLHYYFPFKLDLFVGVVDRYVFDMQAVANKFSLEVSSLSEFIDRYISGVERTMGKLISLLDDGNNPAGCSFKCVFIIQTWRRKLRVFSRRIMSCGNPSYNRHRRMARYARI